MESNWRYNCELVGWGENNAIYPGTIQDTWQFFAELNPPVVFGAGTATWVGVGQWKGDGKRRWVFGNVSPLGMFEWIVTFRQGSHFPDPRFPVLPDH